MLINDLVSLAEKTPPLLAGGWAVWLLAGLILTRWTNYERSRLVVHGPSSRKKSGVRPPVRQKGVLSNGDAFGELEALLDPPTGSHRLPGESPMLTEPARSAPLAAPQSLP